MKKIHPLIESLVQHLKDDGYTIKPSVYYTDTTHVLVDDTTKIAEGLSTTNPEKFREFKELKEHLNN